MQIENFNLSEETKLTANLTTWMPESQYRYSKDVHRESAEMTRRYIVRELLGNFGLTNIELRNGHDWTNERKFTW
jgi:hypothetical protein